jgi:hypothetical protein
MPVRAPYKASKLGGGRKAAEYRDARGHTRDCIILADNGDGTVDIEITVPQSTSAVGVSGIRHTSGNHLLSNVPIATSMKDTEAVFWRHSGLGAN